MMNLINNQNIETNIYEIRGRKVMLDSDLAKLYQVETKRINEAVKNNLDKFPSDFLFELTKEEEEILRSKFSTFNQSLKLRKYRSKVFTEQGVYMLATILKSKVATDVTINIMRTFTKIREFTLNYNDVTKKLQEIEETIKIDQQHLNFNTHRIDEAFELLNKILQETEQTGKKLIGFRPMTEQ